MTLDLSALDDLSVSPSPSSSSAPTAPLTMFEEDPNNPRTEFDDAEFDDFVEDVREHGILQPVIVRPIDGGKLRIHFGARRYRAAVRLQLTEIPYFITEDPRQFSDYAQVSENERRKSLQPLELATFITKKLAVGDKKKDIAAKLKLDPSMVTNLLALIDAPAFLLELYHSRKCRTPKYLYELRRLHERHPEIVERRCNDSDTVDRKLIELIQWEVTQSGHRHALTTDAFQPSVESRASVSNIETAEPAAATAPDVKTEVKQAKSNLPNPTPNVTPQSAPFAQIRNPLLLATYQQREVMILLTHRPSADGQVVIRFLDAAREEEVSIRDVVITRLTDHDGAFYHRSPCTTTGCP